MTTQRYVALFAAVCVQDGPGIENAFGAVAQANGDKTPMHLLPVGYDRDRQDIDPNFQAPAIVLRAFNQS
jgi:acetolactate synthase-1/2/3 large subunit